MSILIKGMEMPPNCFLCKLSYMRGERLFCSVMKNEQVLPSKIDSNCPLIEIQPHGRLIDADALEVQDGWLRDSKYFAQESSHTHITFVYSNDIVNAPTVIPADKDGE